MKRTQLNRLEKLRFSFESRYTISSLDCDFNCGKNTCPLCGIEAQRYVQFYEEHRSQIQSSRLTWSEFFYLAKGAGFFQEFDTYESYFQEASQW